ncbi:MAG: hypothetical protein H6587_11705 [Flavobacteriales bacterium]|nr:hypothetical protein [Flavobacteriales bacterium]MCB9365227.1 hypothetical protein [Flavobacteriales bacterium]
MAKGFFLLLFTFYYYSLFAQDEYVLDTDNSKTTEINKAIFNKPNPDYTSYFTTPTAYTLTKRDFRLASNDILFFKVSYGLTSNSTISLNMSAFSSLIGSIKQNIKKNENICISITASLGDLTSGLKDTTVLFTGCSGQATIGDHQNNLTIGTGIYYINSNVEMINEETEFFFHTINAGFQKQLSKNSYLMLDGLYFTNYNILTGGIGFKFVIKTKYSVNAGVMPVIWNNIRTTRHDFTSGVLPFFSVRMLIERKD